MILDFVPICPCGRSIVAVKGEEERCPASRFRQKYFGPSNVSALGVDSATLKTRGHVLDLRLGGLTALRNSVPFNTREVTFWLLTSFSRVCICMRNVHNVKN